MSRLRNETEPVAAVLPPPWAGDFEMPLGYGFADA